MSSSNPSEASKQSPAKKRRYLSAEKKFQIYMEAQTSIQPIGELLRWEGLYSTDLPASASRSARGPCSGSGPSLAASRNRATPTPMTPLVR